jgi:hypothetical protein
MCELNTYRAGRGGASQFVIERGRHIAPLCRFAVDHQDYWPETVCGLCRGDNSLAGNSQIRCRRHLIEHPGALKEESIDLHVAMLVDLLDRLKALARSYTWGNHGTDRPQDRAALVSAMGFMGGWRPLLALLPVSDKHACAACSRVQGH